MVHDFNAGIGTHGLFWILQVPDDAVTVTDDNTVTISLKDVAVVDQLTFPNTLPNGEVVNLGNSGTRATVSFDITYTKSGKAQPVRPSSDDPLSPFTWAGEMSPATNSGTFSVAYSDGSFSAQGSFSSTGNFGEMGTVRNGSFVRPEDREDAKAAGQQLPLPGQTPSLAGPPLSASAVQLTNSPKFRGKIPVEYLLH
jgi:hypothetical protein